MSFYSFAKFVHVASDIGIFIGIGAQLLSLAALRQIKRTEQARALLWLITTSDIITRVSAALTILAGLYMAVTIAELAVAIRRVIAGERVVEPDLALTALSDGDNPLTQREREVLVVSLEGASIADIATRLYLSEGTVRNHLSMAIQKLGARNRTEAAHLAEEKGWL